jgi:hypothetical protein
MSDPLFGKVREDQKFRGVILTNPMRIDGGRIQLGGGLHPEELRYALLFWDQIVWPSSRLIYVDGGPDSEYLESAGVLSRPDYSVDGCAAQGMLAGVLAAHQDLSRENPRAWALLEGPNSISFDREVAGRPRGLGVDLVKCIPVPAGDVPLPEILEFKHRRRDELLLLRAELERLNSLALLSNDPEEFIYLAMEEIDKACRDVLAVSREWQFPVALADKRIEFAPDLTKAAGNAAAAATLNTLLLEAIMPLSTAFLSGAAAVASQFKLSASPKFVGVRKSLGPYAYAYRIHKELGVF